MVEVGLQYCPRARVEGVVHGGQVEKRPPGGFVEAETSVAAVLMERVRGGLSSGCTHHHIRGMFGSSQSHLSNKKKAENCPLDVVSTHDRHDNPYHPNTHTQKRRKDDDLKAFDITTPDMHFHVKTSAR